MATVSNLIGFARKSVHGEVIKINISVTAFNDAVKYVGCDGHSFVSLVIDRNRLQTVIDGKREVTSVSQWIAEGTVAHTDNPPYTCEGHNGGPL